MRGGPEVGERWARRGRRWPRGALGLGLAIAASGCSLVVDDGLRGPGVGADGGAGSLDAGVGLDVATPRPDTGPDNGPDATAPGRPDRGPIDAARADAAVDARPEDAQRFDASGPIDASRPDAAVPDRALPDLAPADAEPDAEPDALEPDAFAPPPDREAFCTATCEHITRCLNGPTCPGLWVGITRTRHQDCLDTCAPTADFDRLARTPCAALPDALEAGGVEWAAGCDTPDPCEAFAEAQTTCARFACGRLADDAAEVLRLLQWRCRRALDTGALSAAQVALMPSLPCIDPQWVGTNATLGNRRRELGDWCESRRFETPADRCAPACATAAACLPPDDLRSDAALCEGLCRADWQHEGVHDCLEASRDCGVARACGAGHPYQVP